jgi:hypothetical protein
VVLPAQQKQEYLHSPLPANNISDITSDNRAEESTAGKDGSDQRLVGRRESIGISALNDVDEDRVAIDAVDVTRLLRC